MKSILIRPDPDRRDVLIGELWEHGVAGILEEGTQLRAFFNELAEIVDRIPSWGASVLEVRDEPEDPPGAHGLTFDPIFLGSRFFVVTTGMDHPTPAGRIRLQIDATDAFGTGSHESTQLFTSALEAHTRAGSVVADIGCGSGVLSAVALALGARKVIACDTHPGAVEASRKNSPESLVFVGSADSIASETADLVVVNIGARVIDALARDLSRIAKPDGLLVLGGFLDTVVPTRFRPEGVTRENEWLCWICRPSSLSGATLEGGEVQPFPSAWW